MIDYIDLLKDKDFFTRYFVQYVSVFHEKNIRKFIEVYLNFMNTVQPKKDGYKYISELKFKNYLLREATISH